MVVDPFRMDYNPAKVKTDSIEAQTYIKEFKDACTALK